MKGFSCDRCHFIFPREDALEEWVSTRGGPALRSRCPECHRSALEEVHLCEECMAFKPLDDEGYCSACSTDIAVADLEVIETESLIERRPKSELSLLCADIAMTPWRKYG